MSCGGKFQRVFIKEGVTPPDWKVMGLILALLSCSSASINFTAPFLPQMVKDFGYSEVEASYYIGIISSSYHVGRIFGSYLWGYLSDRYERRNLVIFTLVLSAIASFLFGFSTSVTLAVFFGFLNGFVNGAVIIVKSILYEISDNTNQSYGISILSLSYGLGTLVGPLIGGFLSDKSIITFEFSTNFPYLLPCLVLAILMVVITCISGYYLPVKRTPLTAEIMIENDSNGADSFLLSGGEGEAMIEQVETNKHCHHSNHNDNLNNLKTVRRNSCHCTSLKKSAENKLCLSLPNVSHSHDTKKTQFLTIESQTLNDNLVSTHNSAMFASTFFLDTAGPTINPGVGVTNTSNLKSSIRESNFCFIITNKVCLCVSLLYFLLSLAAVYQRSLVIMYATTDQYYGGLSFRPKDMAVMISCTAVFLVVQLFMFPVLERKFGSLRTYIYASGVVVVFCLSLPLSHYLSNNTVLLWGLLLLCEIPSIVSFLTSFAAVSLLVNNSVPRPLVGSMNGFGMTCSSIGRVIGPIISGALFAYSIKSPKPYPLDFNLPFLVLGLIILSSTAVTLFLPQSLDKQYVQKAGS